MLAHEINLNLYPELTAFLASEPADITLLALPALDSYISRQDNRTSFFNLCCVLGKFAHLAALPDSITGKAEATKLDNYCALRLAAKNGHTATIQQLAT